MALGRLDSVTSLAQPRRSTALQQFSLTSTSSSACHAAHLHGDSTLLSYHIPTISTVEVLQEIWIWRREKVRGNFPSPAVPPPLLGGSSSGSSSMGLVCAHLAFPQVLPMHELLFYFALHQSLRSAAVFYLFFSPSVHTPRTTDADILGTCRRTKQ